MAVIGLKRQNAFRSRKILIELYFLAEVSEVTANANFQNQTKNSHKNPTDILYESEP